MKYKDTIPGLEAAKTAGAFVRLGSDCEDFAINFNLGWIIYDSIGTYACVKAWPAQTNSQISRAWLTDDLDRAQPLIDVFELSEEAAQSTGYPEHRTLLFFGPISPNAKRVRLEIQRLEPAGQGLSYLHPMVDPFSNLCDEKAVHIMAWEEPDDPLAPIPIGTIGGCWAFEVDCPRKNQAWEQARRYFINKEFTLGHSQMFLEYLDRGITGWRLSSRFLTEANRYLNLNELHDMLWQVSSPEELIEQLNNEGLLESFAPPVVHMDLANTDQTNENPEYAIPYSEIYGPLGVLNNKFYHFYPPIDSDKLPNQLRIHKVVELPLAHPWIYSFDPKDINTLPTKVDEEAPPFMFRLKLSIRGLYWEEDMILIAPMVIMEDNANVRVDLADCLVRNVRNQEAYLCLGQSLVDMPQPKSTIKREQVYGWQYPPIHKETREARFEVCTVNVTPWENILIDIAPQEQDWDAMADNFTLEPPADVYETNEAPQY